MIYVWKKAKADVREEKHVEPPLSTTNSTWFALALNSGHHEEQPANSRHTKQVGVEGWINEHMLIRTSSATVSVPS
jgi:hypothetical protein